MGMAASQARYIELTARKNNVEYEGQQINQERTNLANESAGLFNQMLALQVPTPPSTSDFTEVQYKFNNGVTDNTITDVRNVTGNAQYNSEITYWYNEKNYTGLYTERSDLDIVNNGGTWYYGTTKLAAYDAATDKTAVDQINTDNNNALQNTANVYSYKKGAQTYYLDVTTAANQPIQSYYAADITEKVYQTELAYLEQGDSGRYTSVQLENYSITFDLNATSYTDDNAYNDAVNEYEYQTELYNQQINNINARTEIIQQEDRTLEMKLKQLDTEQEALNTEMESVKKVIDKNIEQTFKTFQ